MPSRVDIAHAHTEADLADARRLFEAYADSLPVDLAYQHFDDELAGLPGDYAPPKGALLIARDHGGQAIGCIAMRAMGEDGVCEMKRLFVAPAGRGCGLGRSLAEALIGEARRRNYRAMYLDTLPTMAAAQTLYRSLGFEETDAYYDTPVAGTLFMRLDLGRQ